MAELQDRNRDWWLLFFELGTSASRDRKLELRMARMYREARARLAEMIEARSKALNVALPMPADDLGTAVVALNNGFYLQKMVDSTRFPPDFLGHLLLLFSEVSKYLQTSPVTLPLEWT